MSRRSILPVVIVIASLATGFVLLAPRGEAPTVTSAMPLVEPPIESPNSDQRPHLDAAAPVVGEGPAITRGAAECRGVVDVGARSAEVVSGANVRGRTVDKEGDPVFNALVVATRGEGSEGVVGATSARDGAFELQGVRSGKVKLTASANGYGRAELLVGDLTDGQEVRGLEIVLNRQTKIRGRVQWSDGTPSADSVVECIHPLCALESELLVAKQTRCNAEGEFTLEDVGDLPCSLTARIRTRKGSPSDVRPIGSFVAREEFVMPDSEGVVLTLRAAYSLQCRLVDEDGKYVLCSDVFATPVRSDRPSADRIGFVNGYQGESFEWFEIPGLYEGEWEVTARASGYAGSNPIRARVPGSGHLEFVLRRTATLSGFLVDEGGRPVTEALLIAAGDLEVDDRHHTAYDQNQQIDANGGFEIASVPPGHVVLYAKALDGKRVGTLDLDLEPGEGRSGLKVVLVPRTDPRGKR